MVFRVGMLTYGKVDQPPCERPKHFFLLLQYIDVALVSNKKRNSLKRLFS
jgi:hypothetical protein